MAFSKTSRHNGLEKPNTKDEHPKRGPSLFRRLRPEHSNHQPDDHHRHKSNAHYVGELPSIPRHCLEHETQPRFFFPAVSYHADGELVPETAETDHSPGGDPKRWTREPR